MSQGSATAFRIHTEHTACNLCGADDPEMVRLATVRHYGEAITFPLLRCRRCGLVYLSPRPSKQSIGDFYPMSYQADIQRLLAAGQESWIFRIGLLLLRRRRLLPAVPGGRLLDIGCSNGAYLAAARDVGWDVRGIEMDASAADIARRIRGLPVDIGDAEAILSGYSDASYDVVTMWHVLEHLFDPSAVLVQVARILRPGGKFMLEVPNFGSVLAGLLKDAWFPLEPPRHLYHFCPATLWALLNKAGLETRAVVAVPSPESVVWSLRSLYTGPTDTQDSGPVSVNFPAMALAFPLSWLFAKFGRSDSMAATAIKPQR